MPKRQLNTVLAQTTSAFCDIEKVVYLNTVCNQGLYMG